MRKGKQFVWGKEQQNAFGEIKQRLQKPPVLHMPDKIGRFQLHLLGITEGACDWIVCKISKILHDKKNTKDSSAIES